MSLGRSVPDAWHRFRGELFPAPADGVGPPGGTHRRSVAVLDLAEVERRPHHDHRGVGHPPSGRNAPGRAFVDRAVRDLPTTSAPGGQPRYDPTPRRPSGRCRVPGVPSGSTFSRAFAWFAETRLPGRVHAAPVSAAHGGSVVGQGADAAGAAAGGGMSTAEMVGELPKACDVGGRRDAKGYRESWCGYRLHIDPADGNVPVSCIPAPASPRDSQAAIPLSRMTAERVDHCHGLMDAAHDSREIGAHARLAGRVPVTGTNPRRDAGPHPPRPRPPAAAPRRRAGELRPEGPVRRTARPGPRAREGGLPPVFRRARPDGPPADAARRPAPRLRERRARPCAEGARRASIRDIPPHSGARSRPGCPPDAAAGHGRHNRE